MGAGRIAAAIAVVVGLAVPSARSDPPKRLGDEPESYTFGCTRAEARRVSLHNLRDNPAAYLRQCVLIEGVSAGGRDVVADVADFYRHMNQLLDGRVEGIGVGLYSSKLSGGSIGDRERVEIVGRAFSCAELYREAKEAVDEKNTDTTTPSPPPMLSGYCHYYGNAILFVAQSKILDPGPLRLVGREAAKSVGDLDDLTPKSVRYANVWKRATQWFDNVRRESTPQHDDFLAECGGAAEPTPETTARVRDCRASKRRELQILGRGPLPPLRIFIRKTAPFYMSGPNDFFALACVCRTASCEGLWPIHSMDARSAAWPYLCAQVALEAGQYKVD